ncbi:MAG: hypothetical protein ACKOPS_00410, partial [Cyanobium sp.]
ADLRRALQASSIRMPVLLVIGSVLPGASRAGAGPSEGCPAAAVLALIPPPPGVGAGQAPAASAPSAGDYRQQLRPTAHGWPRRDRWCVWVEPAPRPGWRPWSRPWPAGPSWCRSSG